MMCSPLAHRLRFVRLYCCRPGGGPLSYSKARGEPGYGSVGVTAWVSTVRAAERAASPGENMPRPAGPSGGTGDRRAVAENVAAGDIVLTDEELTALA